MNRVMIFGSANITEEATRNSILCNAFEKCADELIYNTISFGFAKPGAPPLIKLAYAFLFAPLRWTVLFVKYLFLPVHNILFVPYPSYMDGWLACLLGETFHKTVIIDGFLGIYDTLVLDRRLFRKKSIMARIIWHYEKCFLSWADIVLVDTNLNGIMLKKAYGLPETRIIDIPVGIDETLWKPFKSKKNIPFTVILWCTFIPLHGANVVAYAARNLMKTDPDIKFLVIGTGQESNQFSQKIKNLELDNLEWIKKFIPTKEIYALLKKSHCCLGVFGNKEKTQRVIPYKIYQSLSSAQPVITANTDVARQIFIHGKNAFLIPPNDPESLSNAILTLKIDSNFSEQIGINGRRLYEKKLSNRVIEKKILETIKTTVKKNKCR